MIIISLFVIKFIIAILFVLVLSLFAEYISPKFSGIISGVPTGTAIILFFYAIEQGEIFASQSSLFNLAGMVSMQVFIYVYFKLSSKNTKSNIFLSSLFSIIFYLIVIFILKQFQFGLISASIISILSILTFTYLFKKIENSTIKKKVKLNPKVLLIRSIIASIVILSLTSIAQIVGPKWAGLLSAFPTTLFPLILIIHSAYGKEHVHTIIKNVPKGQWAMIIYLFGVFFLYPIIGVYLGTLISYSFVVLYLIVLFRFTK